MNPNFDPTRASSASNPQYLRTPFRGKRIPTGRINPIGQAVFNALLLPNFGTAGASFKHYLNSSGLGTEKFRA